MSTTSPLEDHLPRPNRLKRRTTWAALFLGVIGGALGVLVVLLLLDTTLSQMTLEGIFTAIVERGLTSALGSLPEVLAAVLGLSLTVVAIVVQLASQRYSPKIVDLFMSDPVNIGVFSFMVVSCIYVAVLPTFAEASEVPRIAVGTGLVLAVVNFGLLLPYFAHVFAFLQPNNIITQIETDAQHALTLAVGRKGRRRANLRPDQENVVQSVERIADNCVAAVGQHDRNLALHSVRTLERLTRHAISIKETMPEGWNAIPPDFFFALSREFYDEIVSQRIWIEAKALMEFEHILKRALGPMDELVTQLASSSRSIGIAAAQARDDEALNLVVRFFNTFMRHALNAKNVRACYNLFYQYRLLGESIMQSHPEVCERVVDHFVYYGRTANAMGLPFVTVTAAHDVRVLCELAFSSRHMDVAPLLRLFLTLDQRSEEKAQELALIGVRKAQSMLAGYLLAHNGQQLAEQIREDMNGESLQRLVAIRDSILAVTDRKFWEVTDRGFNFDFVEPELRPYINRFFDPFFSE